MVRETPASPDIKNVSVRARADIEGVTIDPTYIEVGRELGPNAGHAKVKGFASDPSQIQLDQEVRVYIGTSLDADPDESTLLFVGKIKKATQEKSGKVVIKAYDKIADLHNVQVRLNTDTLLSALTVIQDLVSDAIADKNVDIIALGRDEPARTDTNAIQIRTPNFTDTVGEIAFEKFNYGSEKRGAPLTQVLYDLSNKIGCRMWTDKTGVINILPYATEYASYSVPFIKEIEAGDDTVDKNKVIVQGGYASSSLGPGASYVHSQSTPRSTASVDDEKEEELEYTIQDDNITTASTANKTSFSAQFDMEMSKDSGEITIVGNAVPRILDVVEVPELRNEAFFTATSDQDAASAAGAERAAVERELGVYGDGRPRYAITSITHVVETQKGYTTQIGLGPDPVDAINRMDTFGTVKEDVRQTIANERVERGNLDAGDGFIQTP